MQYCPNYGKQIPDEVDFCPYCGARISQIFQLLEEKE